MSPDGTKVFVTGYSFGSTSGQDYATVAYDASTGAKLWAKRYNGPGNDSDFASSAAVSPDGTKVYVTGGSDGSTSEDVATLAYDASTGARLWTKRYNGPAHRSDSASSVAVSPDGTKLFVTGNSGGSGSGQDYATLAYNASTGAELWTKRYNGPGNDSDFANWVAVSLGGTKVFVSGGSVGSGSGQDFATLAYNASTGARLWTRRFNGPANESDEAFLVAVSPDETKVFVTGFSVGSSGNADYATLSYDASTGARLWVRRYNPADGDDFASSVAVSPDGTKVFVTGSSFGSSGGPDYATLAYNASTGARLWAKRYNGPGSGGDLANLIAVSPDGTKVFVTGGSDGSTSHDYATIAYAA